MLARKVETRVLVLLMAAAAAVWGFLAVAGEMTEGETLAIDRRLLLALRTPGHPADPIGSPAFQTAMRDVTALGGVTVLSLVTVFAAAMFLAHRKALRALILVGTVVIASLASEGLKSFFNRPRPELTPHAVHVYSASFPSGHSMTSAAAYLTLAMLAASLESRRSAKILVFALAWALMVAIGFSRVYLGVHWPSDVLAGWCAGAGWAFAAWIVLLRLDRRTAVQAPPGPED